MTDDEVKASIEEWKKLAREEFYEDGRVVPKFIIIKPKGFNVMLPWGLSKEQTAHVVRYQCHQSKARGVVHITELWLAYQNELEENQTPSQSPKSKECVGVFIQDIRLGIVVWLAMIQREKETAILSDFLELKEGGRAITAMTGLFTDMLSNEGAS